MESISIRRTVPNIKSSDPKQSCDFFESFLGMQVAMDRDWIITFVSKSNPTAQVNVIRQDKLDIPHPDISIEVEDVNKKYAQAKRREIEIVYPITNESWGVRRFFVLGPDHTVINILTHT